jgi:ribosomal protein L11 methyltransferase
LGTNSIDIVIDPGQAFGTGAHATTRLCLELMLGLDDRSGAFVDLGCGSGVLAITAARLGFAPVIALDFDVLCVEATNANAEMNGVELDVRRYDLRHDGPLPPARTVAANLLAPLLRAWLGQLHAGDAAPGRIIASGLLTDEVDELAAAFAERGFELATDRTNGEWAAVLLTRTAV